VLPTRHGQALANHHVQYITTLGWCSVGIGIHGPHRCGIGAGGGSSDASSWWGDGVPGSEVVAMSRFALNATDESGTFVCTFDLLPVDGGTQVTFHIVFPPMKGVNTVMVPLLFPIVAKPDFRKRLGLLKRTVESGR
jgi:hypothetical protein